MSKVQLDIFGPMTLPEYDERIRGYTKELGVEIEIFHSNLEGETAAVSQSVVAGFGIAGYALALRGIRDPLAAKT